MAVAQAGPGRLLGVASSAADARVLLEALEVGTAGVLLRTEDPLQVSRTAAAAAAAASVGGRAGIKCAVMTERQAYAAVLGLTGCR